MKKTFYIEGEETGAHLRAEIQEKEVVLISHEPHAGRPQGVDASKLWRDRQLATIPIHVWVVIGQIAEEC